VGTLMVVEILLVLGPIVLQVVAVMTHPIR
jgi:hypothetical protein